jgi:hypothetical protein
MYARLIDFSRPSKGRIEQYDVDLDKFYKEYDEWFVANSEATNRARSTVKIDLSLTNSGTSPAEDIDVFLYFGDDFELYNEESYPKSPRKPGPPEKPDGPIAGLGRLSSVFPLGPPRFPVDLAARNVSSPTIRRTNSFEVNMHVKNLKHHLEQGLGPLFATFDSHDSARSFGIEYTIIAANLPKQIQGKLHVIIKRPSAS